MSAVCAAFVLAVGACSSGDHSATNGRCRSLPGHAVALGASEPLTVEVGTPRVPVWFDRHWWALSGAASPAPLALHGTMTLVRPDLSLFRADDGRTFSFTTTTVGCA